MPGRRCLEFRAEAAVANGWLQRAHSLLDDLEPGPDHGWLAINEAAIRLGMDEDTVTARRLGSRAVELGRNSLSVRTPITSRR